jgi:glycosyltransferase involved in cell wall biosynthesis
VTVFHRVCDLRKREYHLEHRRYEGLDVFTINNTFRFCDSFEMFYKNEAIARKFGQVLDMVRPDIVHIQHLIFLSTTLVDEVKKRNIPIIYTLHDYWLICPQWHFLKKDLSLCEGRDTYECINCLDYQLNIRKAVKRFYILFRDLLPLFLINSLRKIYLWRAKSISQPQDFIEKIKARRGHIQEICQKVDMFISPSQFLRKRYIDFGVPQERIKYLRHGIDAEPFKDFKRKKSDKLRFGFIGTILPAKGLHILIEAFNKIRHRNPELRVYGKLSPYRGFESYPRFIKKLARGNNIRFMGQFHNRDVAGIFSGLDILVVPSIWYENSPLVIQEALMARTPVIASEIGGIPELIKDGYNGLLFQKGNVNQLYNRLRLITDNPSLIGLLGQNKSCVKTVKEQAIELEQIYLDPRPRIK